MIHFIECHVPSVQYRGSTIVNHAVNLALCKSVRKSRINWYPDNEGIPAIQFEGCGTAWAFRKESDRDEAYRMVIARSDGGSDGGS